MHTVTDRHWNALPSARGDSGRPPLTQTHLLRAFDEIDYGMLVVDGQGRILHANHLARHQLTLGHIIRTYSGHLVGSETQHSEKIQGALESALRGQRRLLLLSEGSHDLSMTFTPLAHPLEEDSPCVLVMLSRQGANDNLAVRMFARSLGLSPSEELVMLALCRGLVINEIAQEHGVAVSTVRSQIKTLREKAAAPSIRQLLQRINSLPPVVPALRIVVPMQQNSGLHA